MYLKKVKISGFKSFADTSTLEFNKGICAIVGPNGSGKSNIAEAIRWVMGEQSMKGLRVKKGEDLIFAGTDARQKLGRAQVSLYFDNKDKIFPIDFDEVEISRKIFRDGENQYFINSSQVRLKDVAELIAKAKLGLKGYSIIGQGMGDAILDASLKERREIIEGSVGLKEFQLKKNEAELKLKRSKENLKEAKSLMREIAPHLKFLQKQAEKIRQKEELEKNLLELEEKYFKMRFAAVLKNKKEIQEKLSDVLGRFSAVEKNIGELKKKISEEERASFQFFQDLKKLEDELDVFQDKNSEIFRELGRIDAILQIKNSELGKEKTQQRFGVKTDGSTSYFIPLDFSYISEKTVEISKILFEAMSLESVEEIRKHVNLAIEKLKEFTKEIKTGKIRKINKENYGQKEALNENSDNGGAADEKIKEEINSLLAEKENILNLFENNKKNIGEIKEKIADLNNKNRKEKERFMDLKGELREREMELLGLSEKKENLNFSFEKTVLEEEDLKRERDIMESDEMRAFGGGEDYEETRREIERINIRLETIGLIDPDIQKEFQETESRYGFLAKQSEDLEKAIGSLEEVIFDLNRKIEDKFSESFKLINIEFDKFFKIVFFGGSAKLLRVKINKSNSEDEEDWEGGENKFQETEEKESEGVDIQVNLPKKKISGITMMSGGERALTAVALLIALVSISKPPFLVLDEIDAPLDESNSARFGRILVELSKNTQFVIITHNRETMKQAEILYGVTMSEGGVSKILSIKLDS